MSKPCKRKNTGWLLTIIKSKVKLLVRLLSWQGRHLRTSVSIKKQWYGSKYGGFYVCPEFIDHNSIVYSFGVGEDISFDKTIIDNHDCFVFAFDPTPKSINWVKQQQISLPLKFNFFEYGIGVKSEWAQFYLPNNPEHVSGSLFLQSNVSEKREITVKIKSFIDIISDLKHERIDVLKMDIEGAEYEVLKQILGCSIPINQILIEFHTNFFEDGKIKTMSAIDMLSRHGYKIFGISDSFEEVSFINIACLRNTLQIEANK